MWSYKELGLTSHTAFLNMAIFHLHFVDMYLHLCLLDSMLHGGSTLQRFILTEISSFDFLTLIGREVNGICFSKNLALFDFKVHVPKETVPDCRWNLMELLTLVLSGKCYVVFLFFMP